MDIYDRLHDDHVEIRFLMKEIEKTTSRSCDKRREFFQQLKTLLVKHREFEEAVFYTAFSKTKDTKALLGEALNEHHLSAIILNDIERIPIEKRTWLGKFILLREILDHHIKEEECELFVRAKKILTAPRLAEPATVSARRPRRSAAALPVEPA